MSFMIDRIGVQVATLLASRAELVTVLSSYEEGTYDCKIRLHGVKTPVGSGSGATLEEAMLAALLSVRAPVEGAPVEEVLTDYEITFHLEQAGRKVLSCLSEEDARIAFDEWSEKYTGGLNDEYGPWACEIVDVQEA